MERLVAQAGLTLNAGQMADLVLAWRQMVGLVARIPRNRPLLDDQAYVFRLPPPGAAVTASVPARKVPRKISAKAAAKTPVKHDRAATPKGRPA